MPWLVPSGKLWEAEKGLPPPKHARAKDDATVEFLEAFARTHLALQPVEPAASAAKA